MFDEIFSDYFAQKENFLTNLDPRIKIFITGLFTLLIFFTTIPWGLLFVFFIIQGILLNIKIPFKVLFIRLVSPLCVGFLILLIQTLIYGSTPLFKINFFGLSFTGYREGFEYGFLIMTKIISATSMILFLSMTTPVFKLLEAASWFKIPEIFIEIGIFAYRYIFVLLEDAIIVYNAQKIRLGYSNTILIMNSFSILIGTVFIRAYDQSIRTYEAMMLRGYKGKFNMNYENKLKTTDLIFAIIAGVILVILYKMSF